MAIDNFPEVVDDSGPGTDGTLFNNALWVALEAAIEAVVKGIDNPAISASEIVDEVFEARDGEADLKTRLDVIVAGQVGVANPGETASAIIDEVVEGRGGYLSLDERFDNLANATDIQEASDTQDGKLTNDAQTIGGQKTFVLQPFVRWGAATTLPGTVGGQFLANVTPATVPANTTDQVLVDSEIPANALNADGKSIVIELGSASANTGANAKTLEVDVGGTQVQIYSSVGAVVWTGTVRITRIDSDSVVVATVGRNGASTVSQIVAQVDSLNFAAAIDLRILGTTGAASTLVFQYALGRFEG